MTWTILMLDTQAASRLPCLPRLPDRRGGGGVGRDVVAAPGPRTPALRSHTLMSRSVSEMCSQGYRCEMSFVHAV